MYPIAQAFIKHKGLFNRDLRLADGPCPESAKSYGFCRAM
jgi:hypothetical protein